MENVTDGQLVEAWNELGRAEGKLLKAEAAYGAAKIQHAEAHQSYQLLRAQFLVQNGGDPSALPLTPAEMTFIRENNAILAIKSVRERANIGLKEAKDIVDAYRARVDPTFKRPE